jgi:hypothetical protein
MRTGFQISAAPAVDSGTFLAQRKCGCGGSCGSCGGDQEKKKLQRAPAALSRAPEPSSAAPLTVQLAPTHAVEPSRTGPAKTGARQAAVGSGTRVEQHIQTGDVTASGRSQINIGVVNTSE